LINPTHLHTFLAVANHGSFAAASRRLGYTPSAVSQQIAALERELQVVLFERGAHGIRMSSAGRDLIERAQPIVSLLLAFDEETEHQRRGASGRVRIGTFPTASQQLVPHLLATLATSAPGIQVLLDEGEPDQLLGGLLLGELDVVLAYEYDLVPRQWPKGSVARRVLTEDLILLVPPNHPFRGREIDLSDLSQEFWVTSREGTSGARALERACGAVGVVPEIRFRSNDYEVVRGFVRAGLGVALVPALAQRDLAGVGVARLRDLTVRRHVYAVAKEGVTPGAATVVAALTEAARDLADRVAGVTADSHRQKL
jgi:DNA-binding transcriptional LysR family regulator